MRNEQMRGPASLWAAFTWGWVACVLAGALVALAGCAQPSPTPSSPAADEADDASGVPEADSDAHDLPVKDADADPASPEDEGASFDSWAPECLDADGDVTAYALAELKGWQLETMLQQQEYAWNARNQLWVNKDGSVALVVLGPDGAELSDERIAELERGSLEAQAAYRIVTSRYGDVEKAFDALVAKVMVCEDSAFADTSGVAVAYGPSMQRCLVLLSTSDDMVCLTLCGEQAVAEGLFDAQAGRALGTSIDEAFEALAGRSVGSASE